MVKITAMELTSLPLPAFFIQKYAHFNILTPVQEKAILAGLLNGASLLVCAPTASGKTLIATMAIANILGQGKALYIVPLKALAKEKYREYQALLNRNDDNSNNNSNDKANDYTVTIAIGDIDSDSSYLNCYDLLVLTSEKLDSLLRHKITWLPEVKLIIIDEIHLLNDPSRGPTLEVIITLLKKMIQPQVIGLSATIGNKELLASWLEATLVEDDWRPVELKKGIICDGKVNFY